MRRMRALQMMAGHIRTPQERREQRLARRFQMLNHLAEQQMVLIDKIREREMGADGAKPMPLDRRQP